MLIRIACLVVIFFSYLNYANAKSVGDTMNDFWESMGGTSNITKDSNYKGQRAGYVNFGSVYARSNIQRAQIASVQLPSGRAGCGGIDLFAGGFSYIDSDQLVALLKAIGSNATAFAFKIALATLSPISENKMEELKKTVEAINSLNINSCEAGAAIAGTAFSYWDKTNKTACEVTGHAKGYFRDFTDAKSKCGNGGQRNSTNNSANDSDKLIGGIGNINITWNAIRESGLLGKSNFDASFAQYLMTLVGTVIVKNPSDDSAGAKIEYVEPKVKDKEFIAKFLEGGKVLIHKCDENLNCLNLTRDEESYEITAENAFSGRVQNFLQSIQEKIIDNEALSNDELEFLNSTSIPVYKILNVHAAYYRGMPMFEASSYSDLLAIEILYEYLTNLIRIVSDALDRAGGEDIEKLTNFKETIKSIRSHLYSEQQKVNQRFQTTASLIERTEVIENVLADRVSAQVMNQYQWSRSIR